jgi:hypothetical protein
MGSRSGAQMSASASVAVAVAIAGARLLLVHGGHTMRLWCCQVVRVGSEADSATLRARRRSLAQAIARRTLAFSWEQHSAVECAWSPLGSTVVLRSRSG